MSKQPDPWRDIVSELAALKKRVDDLSRRSPYAGTGAAPNGDNGLVVDGDLIIDGNLDLNGQGTVSGRFQSEAFDGSLDTGAPGTTGWAYDNNKTILPEVILRPRSIGNDTLAEPVRPARLHNEGDTFAVTTTWTTVASAAIVVPAGYTQALIMSCATGATAYNSTANVDFLYTRTRLNGGPFTGWTLGSVDVDASGTGVAYDFATGLLAGLTPGSTLTFTGQVSSAFGTWAAINSNVANLDVALLWLR